MAEAYLHYRRAKFSTRLAADRLYTAGHFWLARQEGKLWRIGFTEFATRALGEPVDLDFEVAAGTEIKTGRIVGWIEGFKAITDLFSPMAGRFAGPNAELDDRIGLIQSDPYGRGWLYAVEGTPGDDCVDAHGYAAFLDTTIGKMTGNAHGCRR
jgi:glycine cleavage system H protein